MVTVLYSVQRDKIFEQYDNEPYYLYNGPFRYQMVHFIGDELVVLDIFGEQTQSQKIIPFGRYKGQLVSQVSDPYLVWMTSIALGPLRKWCENEQMERFCKIKPIHKVWRHVFDDGDMGHDCGMDPVWDFGDRD